MPSASGHGSVVRDKASAGIQSIRRKTCGREKAEKRVTMASEVHRVPTYPVWVGNLKDTVKEKDLKRVFSKIGQIASCRVMVDEAGNSK